MDQIIFTHEELMRLSTQQIKRLMDYLGFEKSKQKEIMVEILDGYFKSLLPIQEENSVKIGQEFVPVSVRVRRIYERMNDNE